MNHINPLKRIRCANVGIVYGVDLYTSAHCALGIQRYTSTTLPKESQNVRLVFMMHHNDDFYDPAHNDTALFHGRRLKDWKSLNVHNTKKANTKHIENTAKKEPYLNC